MPYWEAAVDKYKVIIVWRGYRDSNTDFDHNKYSHLYFYIKKKQEILIILCQGFLAGGSDCHQSYFDSALFWFGLPVLCDLRSYSCISDSSMYRG